MLATPNNHCSLTCHLLPVVAPLQVLRVIPYSAAQLYSYEVFKRWFADDEGHLSVHRRLAAGACAVRAGRRRRGKRAFQSAHMSCVFSQALVTAASRHLQAPPAGMAQARPPCRHQAHAHVSKFPAADCWHGSAHPALPCPAASPPPYPKGMVATLLTHPLDTLRLRLAVDPKLRGVAGTVAVLLKEGRGAAFYRGLGASMLGG